MINIDIPFDIPIVLLIYKRKEKIKRILERIAQVKPQKIYIIADGPRNDSEIEAINECRRQVEDCIVWDCEIVRNYANKNRGVYANIGLGARWVFEHEEYAIFLEDDNLPEVTFFYFCKELLERYREDTRILWICGTNYLQKYEPEDGSSYVFTKHLMPCGWASWSKKFLQFYDGELNLMNNKDLLIRLKSQYEDHRLYFQQLYLTSMEKSRIDNNMRPISWDYQMEFALRANNLYGISPKYNQIENIGVDNDSIHGGVDYSNIMTQRFCNIKSFPLEFPLIHPSTIIPDKEYEKKVGKIILYPFSLRLKIKISLIIKKIFKIPKNESIKATLRVLFTKK
ncbi:glycosyltransferase family A protein [Lachnoclostridium phytofermentans]|uniref:Hemolytic protein HlpA-like protein n=1 Tax=Lachnoclostridium phytofermentans (strain ATCC 700394 / DSM 18823 / ISDg) TaxID=357809 RepID=A9KI02_LACP7|nr:glycosyltransferase family A protein [Lachnoclostridium phytofermentans]ABX43849.1 hemolytic protein HlpA-like protein [Lachnoclostridium phytofermentans ISDg]